MDHENRPRKAIAYGRKILYNYFAAGRAGIKLNVFSTGPNLSEQDSKSIFIDGFMGNNSFNDSSRGHGLAFVKYVVELHGGQVGYEPTPEGNNFFFVLPLLS
jgi:K+-sensing histidine kinase KdpD